ncbi:MAG TPA: hypothetical protein VE967_14300, partial [Gemmatimonadaceae bacterium]|nr:hypothetical protein [Gemmatimonadaceae bacterium]
YGRVFHGDTTGSVDAAQRVLIAAHATLDSARSGDGNTSLFFRDPWAAGDDSTAKRLRPFLSRVRVRAESAIVYVARARKQGQIRETTALDAIELGARRIDWIAAKYQFSDQIAAAFATAAADSAHAQQALRDLSWMNGVFQDMRDGYALTRELFEKAWRNENRPYWMTNALARFDVEIQRWMDRTVKFNDAMQRWALERTACAARARREQAKCSAEEFKPKPEDIGMPRALLPGAKM